MHSVAHANVSWGFLLFIPIMLVSLTIMAFWIWMLIDAIKNPRLDQNERLLWVVVIALTHFIGALIYLFVARNRPGSAPPVVR